MGNKEALLRGAYRCLLENGYAATTARDVAGEAGTSLAAIGYHFGSTDHLLQEAIAEGFRSWRQRLTEVLSANSGLESVQILRALGEELATLLEEHRPLLRVFLETLAMGDRAPDVHEHAAALYREERAGVAALVRAIRGEHGEDESLVASILQAAVDGLIVQTVVDPADAPSAVDFLDALTPLIVGPARNAPTIDSGAHT